MNIPGLLPPEKLKKLKEKKDGDEGTSVDDTDGEPTRREVMVEWWCGGFRMVCLIHCMVVM